MSEQRQNRTVDRLVGHIPFNPNHSEIYEEYQKDTFLHADTQAMAFLTARLVNENEQRPRLILLTGDAGHGKTHLVRHLLKELGVQESELLDILRNRCKGQPLPLKGGMIAIHKDLSELNPEQAALLLDEGLQRPDCPMVICVNEGRLRAMLSSDRLSQRELTHNILDALANHNVEPEPNIFVINLNWQMVSLPDGILSNLLKGVLHGGRWRTCKECSSRDHCPIYKNRLILYEEEHRVEQIRRLYELVERLGEVVTIRQVLIHLAYLITGNLTCNQVHQLEKHDDYSQYAFTSNLFVEGAPDHFIQSHGFFLCLRKLDPAHNASHAIDKTLMKPECREAIIPEHSPDRYLRVRHHQVDLRRELAPAELDLDIQRHLEDEAQILIRVFRTLRRHYALANNSAMLGGFEYAIEFQNLLEDRLEFSKKQQLKKMVARGLNRIQSLVTEKNAVQLLIVDRVSLRAAARTAVIAASYTLDELTLRPEDIPATSDGEHVSDARARRLILQIEQEQLELDLLSFEFICRCASGLASREFFHNKVRRITNFLLRVIEKRPPSDTKVARVFHQGKLHSIRVNNDEHFIGVE